MIEAVVVWCGLCGGRCFLHVNACSTGLVLAFVLPPPPSVKKQVTVGAGTCIEEGGDPVPHLEALDPILGELTELETRVKKAPTDEVDDARCGFIVHYYYIKSRG